MEKHSTTAKVVDGTLILTLPDAITPVVWQMQLGQTKSSALEVREQRDAWVLVLKTPRIDVMEIAPFATKAAAVKALMAVSRAMEKAQGQMGSYSGAPAYPVPAVIPGRACSWICRILKWIFYVFVALFAVFVIGIATLWLTRPAQAPGLDMGTQSEIEAPAPDAPAGTPQSADDYLNNQ